MTEFHHNLLRVNIFQYDLLLFPLHVNNNHWSLARVDLRNRSINYYDSLGQFNYQILNILENMIHREAERLQPETITYRSPFVKITSIDMPQQSNSYDCGVFTCMAVYLALDKSLLFTQADMPFLRNNIILEIIQGKLTSDFYTITGP